MPRRRTAGNHGFEGHHAAAPCPPTYLLRPRGEEGEGLAERGVGEAEGLGSTRPAPSHSSPPRLPAWSPSGWGLALGRDSGWEQGIHAHGSCEFPGEVLRGKEANLAQLGAGNPEISPAFAGSLAGARRHSDGGLAGSLGDLARNAGPNLRAPLLSSSLTSGQVQGQGDMPSGENVGIQCPMTKRSSRRR